MMIEPEELTTEKRREIARKSRTNMNQIVAIERSLKQGAANTLKMLDDLGYRERRGWPAWIGKGETPVYKKATQRSDEQRDERTNDAPPVRGSPLVLPSMVLVEKERDNGRMDRPTNERTNRDDIVPDEDDVVPDEDEDDENKPPFPQSALPIYDVLSDGTPVELVRLADGSTAYIQRREQAPKSETDGVGARISQLMWENVDVNTQTIMRKVGLNPEVFQSYAWLYSKVDPETEEPIMRRSMDIGDFINWCVKYTMVEAFGFVPGMVAVGPGNIRRYMEARSKGGVNYA